MRKNKAIKAMLALVIILAICMTGCHKDVADGDKDPVETVSPQLTTDDIVIKAVEELFSNNAMALVQYSGTDYLVCMLNSSHEQQAEPMAFDTDGNTQERQFGKIYLSNHTVIYLKNDGEIEWGPEYSPIDFVEKVAEQHKTGTEGIELEVKSMQEVTGVTESAPPVGTESPEPSESAHPEESKTPENLEQLIADKKVYVYTLADTATYESVYKDLGDQVAEAMEDSITSAAEAEDELENIQVELTVYTGEKVEDFEAYLKYRVREQEYLGWYISGCMPLNEWKLDEQWYEDLTGQDAGKVYDRYNELMTSLQELNADILKVQQGLGVSVKGFVGMSEEDQRALMAQAEEIMSNEGYTYNDGASLDTWYSAAVKDLEALGDDENDAMLPLREVGLAKAIWVMANKE